MALPHLKITSDAIVEHSQKSLRSVKSFFEPCNARQVQKLFSSIHPFTSPPKTSNTPPATFHLFSQLPFEIREIIWTIYLSFPRVHILEPSASPTAQDPWPLNISTRQNPHPSILICRESRALHHKLNWLRTLQKMQTRTQTQIESQRSHLPTLPSFISYPQDERVEWETDIFWFKDIATIQKLTGGVSHAEMTKYDNVRRIAFDYNVLDYEDEILMRQGPRAYGWKKRFRHHCSGLIFALHKFRNLDEVLFVLDVEGDVNEKDGEAAFEDVDVEMRVRRRLERGNDEKRVEARLRFPQVDDWGLYPQGALDVLFNAMKKPGNDPWNWPKVRYVYAKNINP